MNNPFDYIPDKECNEAFQELMVSIEKLKESSRTEDINFCRELEEGKMLGVLIAKDSSGNSHTLYAFSGQLGCGGFFHNGFVGPVYDYLQPDGYFKTKEADISRQNVEISQFEKTSLSKVKNDYEITKERQEAEISQYRENYRIAKLKRDAQRAAGLTDEKELAALIRQSQFEKAEFMRLKKRLAAELEPFSENLKHVQSVLVDLKEKRRNDSEGLQKWLFNNFQLLNARGESKSLSEIFATTSTGIPPSGAGECCAPKLLQAAYRNGWHPVSIAEYWYGKPKEGEVRIHGMYYPACRGKCLPVLSWMLQGLRINPPLNKDTHPVATMEPEIIFENKWFCVVNKPSGMLSVPGKGAAISVQQWLEDQYGVNRNVKVAHRLDQDTSGIIIATFGSTPYKIMQSMFAMRKLKKTYIAELEGDYESRGLPVKGYIELPLSPDWLDRPRQRIDFNDGKEAVTEYEFIGKSEGWSRVIFHPHTGRTHQLRIHSASELGLGMPIVGDRLYGNNYGNNFNRLHLHAQKIEFTFPIDNVHYCFDSPTPF